MHIGRSRRAHTSVQIRSGRPTKAHWAHTSVNKTRTCGQLLMSRAPCTVMWTDLHLYGQREILGNGEFLPSGVLHTSCHLPVILVKVLKWMVTILTLLALDHMQYIANKRLEKLCCVVGNIDRMNMIRLHLKLKYPFLPEFWDHQKRTTLRSLILSLLRLDHGQYSVEIRNKMSLHSILGPSKHS